MTLPDLLPPIALCPHSASRGPSSFDDLTDVATNATGSVNLDEVPSMEEVPGPAGTTVTRLTFRGGHQIDVYETIAEIMQLAHLRRQPVRSTGALQ